MKHNNYSLTQRARTLRAKLKPALAIALSSGLLLASSAWADSVCDPASKTSATLQACVDATASGDTLKIAGGEWAMTAPVKLSKSITIKALDINNRPLLRGAGPLSPNANRNNRAFEVVELNSNISGLTIKEIDFHDFSRAIMLSPELGSDVSTCQSGPAGSGKLTGLTIKDNHFENSMYSISIYGGNMKDIVIKDNTINNANRYGVRVLGGYTTCDGGSDLYGFGLTEELVISNNVFTNGQGNFDIDIWNAPGVVVNHNQILNSNAIGGIASAVDIPNEFLPFNLGDIKHNVVKGPLLPISVWNYDPSFAQVESTISGNTTRGATPWYYLDILVANHVNNMVIKDNNMDHVSYGFFGNVALDPGTYGNKVTVSADDIVYDDGNNSVKVK